jgi:hypothetical protein
VYGVGIWPATRTIWAHTRHGATVATAPMIPRTFRRARDENVGQLASEKPQVELACYRPSARNTRRTSSRRLGSRQAARSSRTASSHSWGPSGGRRSLRAAASPRTRRRAARSAPACRPGAARARSRTGALHADAEFVVTERAPKQPQQSGRRVVLAASPLFLPRPRAISPNAAPERDSHRPRAG